MGVQGDTSGAGTARPVSRPCWSCDESVPAIAPFCHHCGVIQPPEALNHFERLNLAVSFDQPAEAIQRQYFGLQRTFHPDRFAAKSAREQAISMNYAASINEAYRILKSPLNRAEHLLAISGQALPGDDGGTIADPELLIETMEKREELDQAESREAVLAIIEAVRADIEACEGYLSAAFSDGDFEAAVAPTLRLRYLTKIIDEARQRQARFGGS